MTRPSGERDRPVLQRVPPHDLDIERSILGAAMLNADAARILAGLGPDPFYKPAHANIAEAIIHVAEHDSQPDPVTVHAELRRRGTASAIGNPAILTELQAGCTGTTNSAHWADLLIGFHRQRNILTLAGEVTEAVYTGRGHTALVTRMADVVATEAAATISSWEPVNLAQVLAGQADITPTVARRDDGAHLLYPARIHAVNGEPEAAKSLVCQYWTVQQIVEGGHVLYIDFEDSAAGVTGRLLQLGLHPVDILERFHYIRPEEGVDAAARVRIEHALATWPVTLAVIDGVAEVMALSGWKENDNGDIAAFYARLPRLIASHGPAVVLIDHLVKDAENQGRYARGGGHKLAGIDGAVYKAEAIKPFGRGMTGLSRLVLQKDRPGRLREQFAGGKIAAEFEIVSTPTGSMTATLRGVTGGKNDPNWRPTSLMDAVSRALEPFPEGMSKRALRTMVKGKAVYVDTAISYLIADGHIVTHKDGNTEIHTVSTPYRAPEDHHQPPPAEYPESDDDDYQDQPW